jgi:hypothetical protein
MMKVKRPHELINPILQIDYEFKAITAAQEAARKRKIAPLQIVERPSNQKLIPFSKVADE